MKKFFLFLLMALLFIFTSCSDNEVDQGSIEGTIWVSKENDDHYEMRFSFYRNTFKIEAFAEDDVRTVYGEYVYEYPYIWIYNEDGDEEKIMIVNRNKFIFRIDNGGYKVTFVLK